MMMWSSNLMPRSLAPSFAIFVTCKSSLLGSRLFDGWLCARIIETAPATIAGWNTSRGWNVHDVAVPMPSRLYAITSWLPSRQIRTRCSLALVVRTFFRMKSAICWGDRIAATSGIFFPYFTLTSRKYFITTFLHNMAEPMGLEPTTSPVTGERSNHWTTIPYFYLSHYARGR